MSKISQLHREDCPACGETTLHDKGVCTRCQHNTGKYVVRVHMASRPRPRSRQFVSELARQGFGK